MSRTRPTDSTPNGKVYWRSLEELTEDPRALAFRQGEFPEGADEPPDGVNRRTMITLLGASLSMAGLAGCRRPVEKIVPFVEPPETAIPGVARHYATTMPFGDGGYGLVVQSHEGRPTKIEGNPRHPATRGATSAWMQASILDLYDPDRLQHVTNAGALGTWADFVATWGGISAAHDEDGGAGLAVLSEPFSSPTRRRLMDAFRSRFPQATVATWAPLSDESADRGGELVAGVVFQQALHLERARTIVSLDSDFLLTESESVGNARGFAAGRRVATPADSMSRLYVVEGVHSLTGANADHRLRIETRRIPAITAALAEALRQGGAPLSAGRASGGTLSAAERDFVTAMAGDLMQARGSGVVLAGRRQPPEVHAAVLAMNTALNNVGSTVSYYTPRYGARSSLESLSGLVGAIGEGRIRTLLLIGGNPVLDAPADLDFAAALAAVETSVHLTATRNETGELATWCLPRAHYLEAWDDTASVDGTLGVTQPLIEPLFDGKGDVEMLGMLAGGEERPGFDLVRETWQELLGAGEFESRWHDVLHDGLWKDGAGVPVRPPIRGDVLNELASAVDRDRGAIDALELVFAASPAVFDGRYSNNAWLQELPDPITKLTWDNAALISPATARQRGLHNEDVARFSTPDGRSVEAPIWIVPGQADGTVALPLGYGRTAAGRVGNGVGVNAYPLRTTAETGFLGAVEVAPTGATHTLAQTQDHGYMEGRPLVREASLDEFRHEPDFAAHAGPEVPHQRALWEDVRTYQEGQQWGMSIDLNACTGCSACVVACQSENNIPVVGREQVHAGREMHWLRIDRYFGAASAGDDDPEVSFQPIPCMQCENAPCEQVCPVAATVHDDEGLNVMVYNRCIGTRYCSNNCPYKVRRFNYFNFVKHTPEVQQLANNPDVTVRSRGVMEKCTYCVQRISETRIRSKLDEREITDGEMSTACQQACPSRAISFGNIRDPHSAVSRDKSQPRSYSLLEELLVRPRTTYLAKLRNTKSELSDG